VFTRDFGLTTVTDECLRLAAGRK